MTSEMSLYILAAMHKTASRRNEAAHVIPAAIMKQPEQRLGSTRSGMIIRDHITDDINELTKLTRNYGADEHFDAYALFQFLLMRERAIQVWARVRTHQKI